MAKAQVAAARFVTEVAPPPVVSVMRRRKAPRSLDTIAEDDSEQLLACGGSPSDLGFAAAAWSLKRMPTPPPPQPRERAGGFVARDLGKYFVSDAHGCQASGWEGGHMLEGHRRAVHAQELHKVGA